MKRIILLYLLTFPLLTISQELQQKYKQELPENVMDDFIEAKLQQFYMTRAGDRLLLNSEAGYFIFNLENQAKLIGEGNHVLKSNFVTRDMTNQAVNLEEGIEYHVFEEENIVVFLDWNLTKNIIKAVDLSTGKELFLLDNYRYTSSVKEQLIKAAASVAASQVAQEAVLSSGLSAGTIGINALGAGITQSQYSSSGFTTYASPLDNTNKLIVKTEEGLSCISVTSGDELWKNNIDITIGFAGMPDNESVVLINFKESELKKSKRLIVKLDIETGKELWRAEPLSIFKRNRTYMVGDRLILDYFGAEVFDLSTGKQLLVSVKPASVKSANFMVKSSTATSDPSLIFDNYLYTSTWKTFPNSGSGKADFQKYDLVTGELMWEAEKVANGISAAMVDENHLFLRKGKAFGESSLFIINTENGELETETENIDGFVYRQGAGDILTDKYLYRSGKKSIYVFDKQSWEMISEFDVKSAKIGKLQASTQAGNNLLLIGDRGVAFFSPGGELLSVTNLNVVSAAWNDNKCFAFSDGYTTIFNLLTSESIQRIPYSETNGSTFFISNDSDKVGVINPRNGTEDAKNLIFYEE